jgi:hypothetical protein
MRTLSQSQPEPYADGNPPDALSCLQLRPARTGPKTATAETECANTKEDHLRTQVQLRRQPVKPSHAFSTAESKICKKDTASCLCRSISSGLPNAVFAFPECRLQRDALDENKALLSWAVNEWVASSHSDLKSQSAFSNSNTAGERCESAKRMKIQLHARCRASAVHLFTTEFNSRKCAAARQPRTSDRASAP